MNTRPTTSFTIAIAALLLLPLAAFAQSASDDEKQAFRTLFEEGPEELTYTQQVRNAISMNQLQALVDSIEDRLGSFTGVEGDENPYTLTFTNGEATAYMVLNDQGDVAGLQFTQLVPRTGSLDEAVGALLDRPGATSITIRRDGEVALSRGTSDPLAVGSAFKLAVLRAVEQAVREGSTSWDEVIELNADDRSLPSGIMQEWPEGSSVTVEAAAILMMSKSDNTATDLLIRRVGRRAVEAYAPASRPLLTTREAFLLKADDQSEAREEYLSSSLAGRRRVLERLEGDLPPASLFAGGPVHPRIEWFFTTAQLAEIIEEIERVDILAVNPGPINPDDWEEYGYKGGSEPGVINLTFRLVARDGSRYAVSATQSRADAEVDANAFVSAVQAVLAHLRSTL